MVPVSALLVIANVPCGPLIRVVMIGSVSIDPLFRTLLLFCVRMFGSCYTQCRRGGGQATAFRPLRKSLQLETFGLKNTHKQRGLTIPL